MEENGFPLKIFKNGCQPQNKCGECKLVLRNPMQGGCGHRFCALCVEKLRRNGRRFNCKTCRDDKITASVDLDEMYFDNAMKREMSNLPIVCANDPCGTQLRFCQLEDHLKVCKFIPVPCAKCVEPILPTAVDDHLENVCIHRTVQCPYCQEKVVFNRLTGHQDKTCPVLMVTCRHCGAKMSSLHPERHTATCPTSWTGRQECPFGCKRSASQMELSEEDLIREILEHRVTSLTNHLDQIHARVQGLEWKVEERDESDEREPDRERERLHQRLRRAAEMGSSEIFAYYNEVMRHEGAVEAIKERVDKVLREKAVKDLRIEDLSRLVIETTCTGKDGVMIWPIREFSRWMQMARDKVRSSLYSPTFYTSVYGYKMCMRLYPFGDGAGVGTHMSLYLVMMRGRYDNLLNWPFTNKVTFALLDQNLNDHIMEVIRPDRNPIPRSAGDMGTGMGIPRFVPIERLDDPRCKFVQDDTIFIKVIVDTAGLRAPSVTSPEELVNRV